jgi:hypothetical protein
MINRDDGGILMVVASSDFAPSARNSLLSSRPPRRPSEQRRPSIELDLINLNIADIKKRIYSKNSI